MKARASAAAARKRTPQIEDLEARNRELARTLQVVEEVRASLADQYDFAPIGFVTLDVRGCIREINLTAARLLGRERSLLLTMPFFTHVVRADFPVFFKHLRECRNRQTEVISDIALQIPGNIARPVELRSVPVLDPRRSETVYRTAITDITERLRESDERYRELVEFLPDGVFIVRDGEIAFANSAAQRLCGVARAAELIGREFIDCVVPNSRQRVKAALFDEAFATPATEAQLAREDKEVVHVEIVAGAFRYRGECAVLVVARDITRRKTAERHVLTISERERSGFGRDLHDSLCQNLMGAACMAEALRNKMGKIDPAAAAEVREIATLVRNCVDEARNLARGLCPVAMEKSGLVAALHELTVQVTHRSGIGCVLECDDLVAVDDVNVATNVYRIAQEAVSNAIQHGKAKMVFIQILANNGKMTLRVKDDGRGLPVKLKQTGMGLHTMRYRATIIGGSLDVRRERPRGTVVICTFPSHAGAS